MQLQMQARASEFILKYSGALFSEEQEVQCAEDIAALRMSPFQGVDGAEDPAETLPRISVEHER